MSQHVIGVDIIKRKITAIDRSIEPKFIAQAIRAAMAPVQRQAKKNAPQGTETHKTYTGRLVAPGFLKRNIRIKRIKKRRSDVIAYSLAARGDAFYGKILEGDWTYKGGRNKQGRQIHKYGREWLGRAYTTHGQKMEESFLTALKKRIDKAAQK